MKKIDSRTLGLSAAVLALLWGGTLLSFSEVEFIRLLIGSPQLHSGEGYFAAALWLGALALGAWVAQRVFHPALIGPVKPLKFLLSGIAAPSLVWIFPYLIAALLMLMDSRPKSEGTASRLSELPIACVDSVRALPVWIPCLAFVLSAIILFVSSRTEGPRDRLMKRLLRWLGVLAATLVIFVLGGGVLNDFIRSKRSEIPAAKLPGSLTQLFERTPATLQSYLAASERWSVSQWGERFRNESVAAGVVFARRRFESLSPGIPQPSSSLSARVTLAPVEIWQRLFGSRFVISQPSIGLFTDAVLPVSRDIIRLGGEPGRIGTLAVLVGPGIVVDIVELREDTFFGELERTFDDMRSEFATLLEAMERNQCLRDGDSGCALDVLFAGSEKKADFSELWLQSERGQLFLFPRGRFHSNMSGRIELRVRRGELAKSSEVELVHPLNGSVAYGPAPIAVPVHGDTRDIPLRADLHFTDATGKDEVLSSWCFAPLATTGGFIQAPSCAPEVKNESLVKDEHTESSR